MPRLLRFGISEAIRVAGDPRLVPQHGVQHRPEMKTVAATAGNLSLQQIDEIVVVEETLLADRRAIERRQTAGAEVPFAEPLLHRRAEPLLAAIDQVVINVRLGRLLQQVLPDTVTKLVRRR